MGKLTDAQLVKGYADMSLIGRNIKGIVVGSKLLMEVDLETTVGISKSGESINIGTTGGNIAIMGVGKLGVNLYKPNPEFKKAK